MNPVVVSVNLLHLIRNQKIDKLLRQLRISCVSYHTRYSASEDLKLRRKFDDFTGIRPQSLKRVPAEYDIHLPLMDECHKAAARIRMLHDVLPDPNGNKYAISTSDFASFLDYVAEKGVATLTVNQALDLGAPAYSPPSVVVTPDSMSMLQGQSQTFDSAVTGGRPPYTYKWYLNNNLVFSSNGISYNFVPYDVGNYNLYLKITDSQSVTTQSNIVNIKVQYPLSMSTDYGTVSPVNGGYDAGSVISITATPPVAGAGERYIWLGWTGTGSGSYTGMNNPAQITMNGAITEIAQWKHQYLVTLASSGLTPDASGVVLTVGGSTQTFVDLPLGLWVDSG